MARTYKGQAQHHKRVQKTRRPMVVPTATGRATKQAAVASLYRIFENMADYPLQYIRQLVAQFEAGTLPKGSWTHEAHIIVAAWYTFHYSEQAALVLTRTRITGYNVAVGAPNTSSSGYHETITRFWLLAVRKFLECQQFAAIEEAVSALLRSGLTDKHLPLRFYSTELLFSEEARLQWMQPDLQPLRELDILVGHSKEPNFRLTDHELQRTSDDV